MYIYVTINDPENGKRYVIGKLTKFDDHYEFEYLSDYWTLFNEGRFGLWLFPPEENLRSCPWLFPAFRRRLPHPKRPDIQKILERYGLSEYDEFELLRRTGGTAPTDFLEFVDPANLNTNLNEKIGANMND